MSYRLTLKAQADLQSIAQYVGDRNPSAADRLVQRFIRQWEILTFQPYSGQACDDLLPGLRRLVMGNYLAFYRVQGRDVLIVRVIHGKRDLAADDFDE